MIRLYDGYGDRDEIIISGHVLKVSPLPRKKYRNNWLRNFFGLIRLFIVRPISGAQVRLDWNGEWHEAVADKEGFFKFEWKTQRPLIPGWQKARAVYISPVTGLVITTAECQVFIPHVYQYNFISDIDDTFLISHSSNPLKRLYVLFTRNAVTRQPFRDVVKHYRLLARAGATGGEDNAFFYVSSSEWNLYDYIRKFNEQFGLPRGVFQLSQMKQLKDLLNTGQGKHQAKYIRIARILKCYPNHKYILLGDNSQMDPEIYAAVVRDFPGMILAVYIRNVNSRKEKITTEALRFMESSGVKCCYFKDSSEAIQHSVRIGLIDASAIQATFFSTGGIQR